MSRWHTVLTTEHRSAYNEPVAHCANDRTPRSLRLALRNIYFNKLSYRWVNKFKLYTPITHRCNNLLKYSVNWLFIFYFTFQEIIGGKNVVFTNYNLSLCFTEVIMNASTVCHRHMWLQFIHLNCSGFTVILLELKNIITPFPIM